MVPHGELDLPEGLFDPLPANASRWSTLVLPVVVWKKGDGRYAVIDGCKRVLALRNDHKPACACASIESTFDDAKAGLLRIELNGDRTLSLCEKLFFIRWLKTRLSAEDYATHLHKLSIPPGERHDLEALIDCRDTLIQAVLKGTLDPAVAPDLEHLDDDGTAALLHLFAAIPFSRQMQRELAEWLHEIASAGRITLRALLSGEEFAQIIADKRLNAPQKAARFHESTHALRYPLLAETKKRWLAHLRKANPDPAQLSFHAASPFFEKSGIEIRIKAERAEKLIPLLKKLADVPEKEWRQIIDPTEFL